MAAKAGVDLEDLNIVAHYQKPGIGNNERKWDKSLSVTILQDIDSIKLYCD